MQSCVMNDRLTAGLRMDLFVSIRVHSRFMLESLSASVCGLSCLVFKFVN
jgi:hypothetical protein